MDAILGVYTSIRDTDHGLELTGIIMQHQTMRALAITVNVEVWIGRVVAVLEGCNIGVWATVAANAVVNKNALANTVVGGIPAK